MLIQGSLAAKASCLVASASKQREAITVRPLSHESSATEVTKLRAKNTCSRVSEELRLLRFNVTPNTKSDRVSHYQVTRSPEIVEVEGAIRCRRRKKTKPN